MVYARETGGLRKKSKRSLFCKKAPQKTFALGCRAFETPREAEQSFFAPFFSKKGVLTFFRAAS
jgi:hypothetical protein